MASVGVLASVVKAADKAGKTASGVAGAAAGAAGAAAGAATGAGAAAAAAEANILLLETARPEAMERARSMCFSSSLPLPWDCPPAKPTRQQLWDMVVVFCTFNSQGKPLPKASAVGSTSTRSTGVGLHSDNVSAAASATKEAGIATVEGSPGSSASITAMPVPAAPAAPSATVEAVTTADEVSPGSSTSVTSDGQDGASAAAPAATAAATIDGSLNSTAATASSEEDPSADGTSGNWQTARSKKKVCRGFRAGWGCSRPDTCKLYHPTVCNGPCRRAGAKQSEGCTGWHLWCQWGLEKPKPKGKAKPKALGSPTQMKTAQGNAGTGSSKAKAAPKTKPMSTSRPKSMSEKMRELEI